MTEYHKIQTVFLRDPTDKFKSLLIGQWAKPEFDYLQNNRWMFTEKIDGTNIRVIVNDGKVSFGGRTDDAQMPTFMMARLNELFTGEKLATVFPDGNAVLYGEGFGAKIQKGGGNYIKDGVAFILFDVRVGTFWLERANVSDVAQKLGIREVPLMGFGTLHDAVKVAKAGITSTFGPFAAEGLVMRPEIELFARNNDRVIAKIKTRDFEE
mgnify:CR=1 FL=1